MTAATETTTHVDLRFPSGLVGFPLAQNFRLTETDGGLYDMQCLDIPDMAFVVVASGPFFPQYSPTIDPETAERLGLSTADDALVLLLVNLGSEDEAPGANLLAPIVINRHTNHAMQVALVDQDLPLRATFPVD